MSMFAFEHSVGDFLTQLFGGAGRAVAAGAGDNTEVDGGWGDRTGSQSCFVDIAYTATLTAAATLSFTANLQDATSSAGAGAADFGTALSATVVATGPGGGGTVTGVYRCLETDLAGARAYIQAQITPNLSAGATDLCTWAAVIILPKETV
jgi:hypothetical protein